jgi:hypothetical protein
MSHFYVPRKCVRSWRMGEARHPWAPWSSGEGWTRQNVRIKTGLQGTGKASQRGLLGIMRPRIRGKQKLRRLSQDPVVRITTLQTKLPTLNFYTY